MNKFIPKHGGMEMWVVCTALGGNSELFDKMKKNEDGSYPVVLSVGGVELDFNRFCKRLDEAMQELAMEKAKELVDEKYGTVFDELEDIRERLEHQKKELFSYSWEKES